MATSQLRTLENLKTQVERPINSPTTEETKYSSKQPFDPVSAAASFHRALPEGKYKDATYCILKTLAKGEYDLESVAGNLMTDLDSADPGKSRPALNTLQHILSLYDVSIPPTDPDGPVIEKMREAVDIYQMINGD